MKITNLMVTLVYYLIKFEINLDIDTLNGKEINQKINDLK